MAPGLDSTKEELHAYAEPFLARGMAVLAIDGPGQGEAEYEIPICGDYERAAKAVVDFLEKRNDVDKDRIAIWGVSLGGYYAPRAAAMEPRFACCIAWGAQWDYWQTWHERFEKLARSTTPSLSVPWQHLLWAFNVDSREAAMQRLEGFRLDGVVQRIACPFLMVHGAGDEQIPLALAERCFAAVGSRDKTLRVFTREEGGYHHCQIDNVSIGVAAMWDWLEDVLKPRQ
jgi:dipeptidyl aminopeptidase/acylaminoacyl peptidase